MLKKVESNVQTASNARFAIVASKYNGKYVDSMLRAAKAVLKRAGAKHVEVVRVPGAYEVPLVAAAVAARPQPGPLPRPDAVICLGVILRGETVHAAHIGEAVSRALMELQLRYRVPMIHEVLLLENENQAKARCLSKVHNRGTEAAQTAIHMAGVMKSLGRHRSDWPGAQWA